MNDNKKDNKKKLVLAAIALLLLIGIGSVVVMNGNKEDENLQASNNIEETQEVESSIIEETKEIESSEVVESTKTVESVPETVETEVVESTEVSTTIEETTVATTPEPEEERLYDDSYYDENGNFNPYTDEVAAPYEGSSSNSVTIPDTSNVEYTLPYIVNGIDIRNGDNDGDGISDNHQNTWWNGVTWTSSNGIVLRVADGFELNPGHMNVYSVFVDGTEDIRPNSDFMKACHEFWGDAYAKELDLSDLPNIIPVSTKQTTINENYPSFAAYRVVFDSLWQKQNGSSGAMLQPYSKNGDGTCNGIGLLDTLAGASYMWNLDYDSTNGYWILAIKSNYTELQWNSILNSLRLITPDADAVFDAIYQDYYNGFPGLECNNYSVSNWITIGSTQLQADLTANSDVLYNIK